MNIPDRNIPRDIIALALEEAAKLVVDPDQDDIWVSLGDNFDMHYKMQPASGMTVAIYPVVNGVTSLDWEFVLIDGANFWLKPYR